MPTRLTTLRNPPRRITDPVSSSDSNRGCVIKSKARGEAGYVRPSRGTATWASLIHLLLHRDNTYLLEQYQRSRVKTAGAPSVIATAVEVQDICRSFPRFA